MDRDTVRRLRTEFQTALDAVAARNGLKAEMGTIRFDSGGFRCRLDVGVIGDGAVPKADALARVATAVLGMPPDVVGRRFRAGGTVYTVTDIKPSRPTYPVSATGPKGGRYKFTVEQVLSGLEAT